MWILLENGELLNTDLITNVVFNEHGEHAGRAICYNQGIVMCQSTIAYQHFKAVAEEGAHYSAQLAARAAEKRAKQAASV